MIYQEFLVIDKINELAAFDPNERLRFAVHEIVTGLKVNQQMTFLELSNKLKDYKINISEEILKKIFEDWDRYNTPDYSVFKKEDKSWMDVWVFQGYLKKKARDKQNFGKHRKKIYNTGTNYNNRGYSSYGYYYGD